MKKIFFIGGMILCLNLISNAQSTHFGLKAGLNSSSINVEDGNDFDSKTGFHVGGLAHIHITKHFAVQPEIMYSTQGGKARLYTRDLDYINVPVLAQYMAGNGFRLQTGPQIGFLVSAKDEAGINESKIIDELNKADLAWSFGASYVSKMGLGLDARYNLGLSNMNENKTPPAAKNRVFQVGAFYQFEH